MFACCLSQVQATTRGSLSFLPFPSRESISQRISMKAHVKGRQGKGHCAVHAHVLSPHLFPPTPQRKRRKKKSNHYQAFQKVSKTLVDDNLTFENDDGLSMATSTVTCISFELFHIVLTLLLVRTRRSKRVMRIAAAETALLRQKRCREPTSHVRITQGSHQHVIGED